MDNFPVSLVENQIRRKDFHDSPSNDDNRGDTKKLPRLVRMRTIKLMSFSGFVLTETAYYPRGRTIQLFTS